MLRTQAFCRHSPTPPPPEPGWAYADYAYGDPAHAHAVTALSTGETYQYDANGNMTTRVEGGVTYAQAFDAENRLVSVTVSGQTTQFVYDGDGQLVKRVRPDGTATVYIGALYEVELSAGGGQAGTTSYYALPGARVQRSGASLSYVLTDHLGSASVTLDATGNVVGEQRYYPFGATRAATGTMGTDRLFTGQRDVGLGGLMHFGARFYSGSLGRFISADTIVPDWTDPQSLNRYSYVYNRPTGLVDPSGYSPCDDPYWPTAFKGAQGRLPTAEDYSDCSFADRHRGSGSNGTWTRADWEAYHLAKQIYLSTLSGLPPGSGSAGNEGTCLGMSGERYCSGTLESNIAWIVESQGLFRENRGPFAFDDPRPGYGLGWKGMYSGFHPTRVDWGAAGRDLLGAAGDLAKDTLVPYGRLAHVISQGPELVALAKDIDDLDAGEPSGLYSWAFETGIDSLKLVPYSGAFFNLVDLFRNLLSAYDSAYE